jgi:thiamine pyrophosphokinase
MSAEWDPTQFFSDSREPIAPFALLVLNQPINERAFAVLKKHGMCLHTVQRLDTNTCHNQNRTG